jgi:segregation and condensation protein B
MEAKLKRVEAILFAVGKEITPERIASLCSLDVKEVKGIMETLISQYQGHDNSLKIIEKDDGYKLTVRDEYVPLVSNLVSSTELEGAITETLAVIAWKYPIVQSDVIKLRGSGAYEHMRLLQEQGFIAKEKSGRTYKIKLTGKFFEYFDLPSEEAKQAFLKEIPAELLTEAENVDKEIDEAARLQEKQESDLKARQEIKGAMAGVK